MLYTCTLDQLLTVLQRRALKIILQLEPRTRSNEVYRMSRTMSVFDIFKIQNLIFMYKYVNGILPDSFKDRFPLCESVTLRNTRSQDIFYLRNTRLTSYRSSISALVCGMSCQTTSIAPLLWMFLSCV